MDSEKFYNKPETTPEFLEYYERLAKRNAAPLWESLAEVVPVRPRPRAVPAIWRYDELRPLLMESGRLITARLAERRVLMLANPGLPGISQITDSLYAGLQLIMPGEVAPTHRHTASALRFIVEGNGAYTAVEGERTTMQPGDFILTPSWTYHDHGNPSDTPTVWMDGLDLPLVNTFNTGFAEHYPDAEVQPITRCEGDSTVRYGANLLPVDYTPSERIVPVFNYPYARSREVLHRLYKAGPLHPCHGMKLQYIDPTTGGDPLTMIGAFLQLLPSGFRGHVYRSTDATVFCVVEGRGRSQVGDAGLAWKEHDIFVVPSWYPVSHEAESEAVLFSFSDRPVQKALGIWREQVS